MVFFLGQEWEEKRRQNIEKMNEEMERIAEYERGQRVRVSVFMEYFYQVSSDAHVCWSVNHSSHIIDWTPQVSFPFICQFVIISVPVLVLLPIYDLFFFQSINYQCRDLWFEERLTAHRSMLWAKWTWRILVVTWRTVLCRRMETNRSATSWMTRDVQGRHRT